MSEVYHKVSEFNKKVLDVHHEHRSYSLAPRQELEHLYKQLQEEVDEYRIASLVDADYVETIDALIDLIYFAMGGLIRNGLSPDDFKNVFEIIHSANMRKDPGIVHKRATEGVLDAVKPEDWEPPNQQLKAYFINREIIGLTINE